MQKSPTSFAATDLPSLARLEPRDIPPSERRSLPLTIRGDWSEPSVATVSTRSRISPTRKGSNGESLSRHVRVCLSLSELGYAGAIEKNATFILGEVTAY